MGIDCNARCNAKRKIQHNVSGFTSHSWQFCEFLHSFWYFAMEFFGEHLGCGFEVSGFVVVKACGVDVFFDFCYWGFGVVFGGGVFFEECWGDFVDLGVGGLGGEHGGY